MDKETKEPTEYEKYCQTLLSPVKRGKSEGVAKQQEDDMQDLLVVEDLKEYQHEGVFVRGH